MFDEVYLPAARSLAERGVFSWIGGIFNWDQVALLKGLSAEQVDPLLELMTYVPRLGSDGEAMLGVIAAEHVQAVIDLIGRRFQHDSKDRDIRYEDLPHGLYSDIPQVACRLTSRSPDFARWASVFRPERCLSSRKRPKSGGSSLEPAAFWPGRAAFPRGRRTCPAAFVQLGHGSWSCA